MKANKIVARRRRGGFLVALAVIAAAALLIGLAAGYERLRALYLEQCVITDMAEQVSIVSGKMVKPDVLAESFGLRKGANLALIDFEAKREEILRKIPTLRTVSVSRRLPDRVSIRAEERTPAVRMNVCGLRAASGRVADAEGMVFSCLRGTQALPTIREPRAPGTAVGQVLKGRARAALDLVQAWRESGFAELGLLEVDTSKADYLFATLGDYSRLKICWDGMDETTPASKAALKAKLGMLLQAVRVRGEGLKAVIWNATLPDRISVDTQERL